MSIGQVSLIGLLGQRMSWLSARQGVLADNIANADTPGYAARDVKEPDFEALLSGRSRATLLSATNARHFSAPEGGALFHASAEAVVAEPSPTGNAVALEQEMIKISDTQAQYAAATNLYRKAVGMLRIALGGGRSA